MKLTGIILIAACAVAVVAADDVADLRKFCSLPDGERATQLKNAISSSVNKVSGAEKSAATQCAKEAFHLTGAEKDAVAFAKKVCDNVQGAPQYRSCLKRVISPEKLGQVGKGILIGLGIVAAIGCFLFCG